MLYKCEGIPESTRRIFTPTVERLFEVSLHGFVSAKIRLGFNEELALIFELDDVFGSDLYISRVVWELMCEKIGRKTTEFYVRYTLGFLEWKRGKG